MRLLPLLLLASAAQAAPPLIPATDVAVDYQVEPAGQSPVTVHAQIQGQTGRARITSADLPMQFILDLPAHRATLLSPQLHAFHDVRTGNAPFPPVDATYAARGHRTLAGLTCEDFAVRLHRGSGTVCVTSDGVILRAQGQDNDGHAGTLTALRVVHAPIDPKQFDVPPDYADIGAMLGRFAR